MNKIPNPIEVRLECDCGDPWHMVVIRYYQATEWTGKDGKTIVEDIPELYFKGKMHNGNTWKRIKNAVNHIIRGGYQADMDVMLFGEELSGNLDKLHTFSKMCLDAEKDRKKKSGEQANQRRKE